DVITPRPCEQDFPTLLPLPAPRLRTYPIETVVAEKFEAIVRLGHGNSRMKDFRDLTTFARRREFDGDLLSQAVQATFERRRADLADLDEVFEPTFYDDEGLGQRWRAYCRTAGIDEETFTAIGNELMRFLRPLADALRGKATPSRWNPRSGWEP
ncbi:MAG: nucleotidyl transferase AbiEii/AbiGii toxin family protein, partial [Planctomycetes bacterium]|nr:nucleotidyl transferase AbiEii/AbiGii toxin family protein [Planctomycetota bacterium]